MDTAEGSGYPMPKQQMSQRAGRSDAAAVALLWGFAFLSYVTRLNITVAQQYMAREFHFSDLQVGYLFTAFLVGYTLFQFPGGALGDIFGPRLVLGICAIWWAATTFLSGAVPAVSGVLVVLVAIRFLHGVGEGPTYPVAMTALSRWFSPERHALITALIFTGSTAGSAFAAPVVAHIMYRLGWRATFYCTALLPLLLALFWFPTTRRLVRGPTPERDNTRTSSSNSLSGWWRLLRRRNTVALCLSYFSYCYAISIFVYWLFKYLVDVRHLSIINSGWVNSVPWIAASLVVPALGWLSTRLAKPMGALSARRAVAVVCLLTAAVLMYVSVSAEHIVTAVAAITASVALLFSTESSYWSTSIEIASEEAGASGGLMNLAGNLGGVAATSLIPVLVLYFGWITALLSGSAFAVLAAIVWFAIHKTEAMD